jgi:uncharacterized membrane-anchored protein
MTGTLRRASSAAAPLVRQHFVASKVPAVTLLFWIIKIAATTLGETGGDTLSMTLNLGYLTSTVIFLVVLAVFVTLQISAKRFHPFLYWATIIASTTAGTTLADFADRSLGIGYAGGRCCSSDASWPHWRSGIARKDRSRSALSILRASRLSTGSPSPSRRRSAPPWATGRPTLASVTWAVRCCSARCWP